MLGHKPTVVPIEIFPADWCIWCDDPDHSGLDKCHILTMRRREDGAVTVAPCGCTDNLVVGKKGDYIIRVTKVQKE